MISHAEVAAKAKLRKVARQAERRKIKPGVNSALKKVLGELDYLEVYTDLLTKQKGVCYICRKPPKTHRLHMDHDHETMAIRGLLCYSCNTKLGWMEKYLFRIVKYLDKGKQT